MVCIHTDAVGLELVANVRLSDRAANAKAGFAHTDGHVIGILCRAKTPLIDAEQMSKMKNEDNLFLKSQWDDVDVFGRYVYTRFAQVSHHITLLGHKLFQALGGQSQ